MLYVSLAGGHLYGKQLFTWLSLVVSLMASLCVVLFLFPSDVLDEIWDVIASVSEDFLPTLIQMMSLTLGLFTQVSDSGPRGPLVSFSHSKV